MFLYWNLAKASSIQYPESSKLGAKAVAIKAVIGAPSSEISKLTPFIPSTG
jgi:hypothetical protein